jgi:hypothetical protein
MKITNEIQGLNLKPWVNCVPVKGKGMDSRIRMMSRVLRWSVGTYRRRVASKVEEWLVQL